MAKKKNIANPVVVAPIDTTPAVVGAQPITNIVTPEMPEYQAQQQMAQVPQIVTPEDARTMQNLSNTLSIEPIGIPNAPEIDLTDTGVEVQPDALLNISKLSAEDVRQRALERDAENRIEQARVNLNDLYAQRRQALEGERSNNIRLAALNSIGNALTTMVQPIGWGVGGSTGGVQPYDNRQYLDAFNRAVRAGDDLRNLGAEQASMEWKLADRDAQRSQALADMERKRNETQKDYISRLDRQFAIKSALAADASSNKSKIDWDKVWEERKTAVAKAWWIHGKDRKFSDFVAPILANDKNYFGPSWKPSEKELKEIVEDSDKEDITSEIKNNGDGRSSGSVR